MNAPNGAGARVPLRLCKCSHPQSWHESGSGRCSHGCGCEQFRSHRSRRQERLVMPIDVTLTGVTLTGDVWIPTLERLRAAVGEIAPADVVIPYRAGATVSLGRQEEPAKPAPKRPVAAGGETLGRCERQILGALLTRGEPTSRTMLGILTGYSHRAGGFGNALGRIPEACTWTPSRARAAARGATALDSRNGGRSTRGPGTCARCDKTRAECTCATFKPRGTP